MFRLKKLLLPLTVSKVRNIRAFTLSFGATDVRGVDNLFPFEHPLAAPPSSEMLQDQEATLCSLADGAKRWLSDAALPLWWSTGADRVFGGFHEEISQAGVAAGGPRRTRVVGRQIYSYSSAILLGGFPQAIDAVDHGVKFLLQRSAASDEFFHSSVLASGAPVRGEFDLYDHAFALFGMAAAARVGYRADYLAERSLIVLRAIRRSYLHQGGGYCENSPAIGPLLANPHMHLLEACLEWIDVFRGDDKNAAQRSEWMKAAEEIIELAMTRFIQRPDGQLFEYFDLDWSPLGAEAGQVVEPGHQYEWAWLLMRWSALVGDATCREAALRMIALSERFGLARDGMLVVNALSPNLGEADTAYRLWPNTERLKAHIAVMRLSVDEAQRLQHARSAIAALRGLSVFLNAPISGLWIDRFDSTLRPIVKDAPASSLYHIVCALRELIEWRNTIQK